jgi:hypothetical protein
MYEMSRLDPFMFCPLTLNGTKLLKKDFCARDHAPTTEQATLLWPTNLAEPVDRPTRLRVSYRS